LGDPFLGDRPAKNLIRCTGPALLVCSNRLRHIAIVSRWLKGK